MKDYRYKSHKKSDNHVELRYQYMEEKRKPTFIPHHFIPAYVSVVFFVLTQLQSKLYLMAEFTESDSIPKGKVCELMMLFICVPFIDITLQYIELPKSKQRKL